MTNPKAVASPKAKETGADKAELVGRRSRQRLLWRLALLHCIGKARPGRAMRAVMRTLSGRGWLPPSGMLKQKLRRPK